MSFAYIRYGNELDCGKMKRFYIRYFGRAEIKEMKGFGKMSLEVRLPYGKMEQDISLRGKINERVFEDLRKRGISIAAAENFINIPPDFERCDGSFINAAFAGNILDNTAEKENIKLCDAEIVIKDGGDEESIKAVLSVAEYVENLSVFTDRKEKLEPFLEKIYNETGLCVGCFSDGFGKQMKEADIIINCSKGSDRSRIYKKGIMYIGLFSKARYLEELAFKRRDLKIYGVSVFGKESTEIESVTAEAALRSMCKEENLDFKNINIKEYALEHGIQYIRPYFAQSTGQFD